jgi:cell division protein FtsB
MPLVVCAALLAITYFGYGAWRYVAHNVRLSSDEAALRSDIKELDEQRAQLVAVRDYLRSDEYVEYVARSVLGLVKPGETLVIVSSTAPELAATATPATSTAKAPHEPWWKDLFVRPHPALTPSP